MFAMTDEMITVTDWISPDGEQMFLQINVTGVHTIGEPNRIGGKTFILCAVHVLIPTGDMPRIIGFANQLRTGTGTRVMAAADAVMHTDGTAAASHVGDGGSIIAFHIVCDVEF